MQSNDVMLVQMTVSELKDIINTAVNLGLENFHNIQAVEVKDKSKEIMTRTEVSILLNVSLPTLWKWNKDGTLKATKIGNRVFYKKEDLLKLVNIIP